MQDFRRLYVWKRAHALALNARRATEAMPRRGYASLKTQLIRAAESIATNVVEGCAAASQKEFARFLEIAIKSAAELEYHLQLAHDNAAMGTETWRALTSETVQVRRMLIALRHRVLESEQ